ncbi:MAG: hypothetical protein MUC31_00805 [Bacteroidales bacterium]|jgi:hypothetical protein|nr:hypothetical protein [Bacteroidales bacterium]
MDDFIYLLVLIAWVVFAFYRKSQKKGEAARRAQQRQDQPPAESIPFPTLEEILLGKEPVPEPEPVPAAGTYTTDGIPPVQGETAFEREYNLRGITSVEEMDRPLFMEKSKQSDIQEDEILVEDLREKEWMAKIDLRQAVIYSEILNRPYV